MINWKLITENKKQYNAEIRVISKAIKVFNNQCLNCTIEERKVGFKETLDRFKYMLLQLVGLYLGEI